MKNISNIVSKTIVDSSQNTNAHIIDSKLVIWKECVELLDNTDVQFFCDKYFYIKYRYSLKFLEKKYQNFIIFFSIVFGFSILGVLSFKHPEIESIFISIFLINIICFVFVMFPIIVLFNSIKYLYLNRKYKYFCGTVLHNTKLNLFWHFNVKELIFALIKYYYHNTTETLNLSKQSNINQSLIAKIDEYQMQIPKIEHLTSIVNNFNNENDVQQYLISDLSLEELLAIKNGLQKINEYQIISNNKLSNWDLFFDSNSRIKRELQESFKSSNPNIAVSRLTKSVKQLNFLCNNQKWFSQFNWVLLLEQSKFLHKEKYSNFDINRIVLVETMINSIYSRLTLLKDFCLKNPNINIYFNTNGFKMLIKALNQEEIEFHDWVQFDEELEKHINTFTYNCKE